MFIFKKHLSRRTFLQGTGAVIALPFLDAMAPAQTPVRLTAASPTNRLACFYVPHGATMDKWRPAPPPPLGCVGGPHGATRERGPPPTRGGGLEFSETLKPLEQFREHINVV